jgi:hypothetical protein
LSLSLIAGAGLAACDARPGVAASLGDVVVTEAEAATVTAQINAVSELGGQGPSTVGVIALTIVIERYCRDLVNQTGDQSLIDVAKVPTADEFETWMSQGLAAEQVETIMALEPVGTTRSLLMNGWQTAYSQAVQDGLIGAETADALNNMVLNPRYGVLDNETNVIEQPAYPWAVSVSQPTPSAEPQR